MDEQVVSIIIPVYNVEQYLKKCLDSVCTQSYHSIEIIVVDDGTQDNSGIICDEYAKRDSRIRVIHKENGGLSDARNVGMRYATGNYIMFVDSDDWMEKDMVEYLYQNAIENQADIAICGKYIVQKKKIEKHCSREKRKMTSGEALMELVNNNGQIKNYVMLQLWKREIIEGIIFPKGKIFEDIYVTYKVFERARNILLLNEAKYYYLRRKGSISLTKDERTNKARCDAHEYRYIDLGARYPELKEAMLEQYFYAYRKMVREQVKTDIGQERSAFFLSQMDNMKKSSRLNKIEKQEVDVMGRYRRGNCLILYLLEILRIISYRMC